jgi:CheY-like chemotaxis protein
MKIAILEADHVAEELEKVYGDYPEMPELNGLDATREIRQFEFQNNLDNIPIIALTAHADVQYQQECKEAGMDNHLPKPIIMDQLVQELAQVNASLHHH